MNSDRTIHLFVDILGLAAVVFKTPLGEKILFEPNYRLLSCGSRCGSRGYTVRTNFVKIDCSH